MLATMASRLIYACVLSDAFQQVWWNSWYLRESVKYCITAQIAYAITCYLRDAVTVGFTLARECLCMCRRRPAADRLRASLRRSIQWDDDSIWIPDAEFDQHSSCSHVQRDASGVTWRRVMSGNRASVPVFNFEDTPPQSRHPTPHWGTEDTPSSSAQAQSQIPSCVTSVIHVRSLHFPYRIYKQMGFQMFPSRLYKTKGPREDVDFAHEIP